VTQAAPALPQGDEDPYLFYEALRATRPVSYNPGAGWVLVRHADVSLVLRGAGHWVDPRWVADPARRDLTGVMRGVPDHARFRHLALPGLGRRSIQRHAPAIECGAADVMERASTLSTVEITSGLAVPLSLGAIREVFSLHDTTPELDARLARIATSARGFRATGTFDPIGVEIEDLDADLLAAVRRHREPRDDLVGTLLTAGPAGDGLTEEQVVAILRVLIVAGLAPLTNMIGNAIVTLVQSPSWAETIGRSRDAATVAVEELLRWDPSIHLLSRVATADRAVAGWTVRKGDVLTAVVAAANRDGERFREADRLDLQRRPNPHLTLGLGEHACPGAPLVRLVMVNALRHLARCFPDAGIVGQPRYAPAAGPRGLQSAVLRLRATHSRATGVSGDRSVRR
jgi:cytochrome P450